MDINNQCLSVFKSFIKDIIKVFPEYQIKLEYVYGTLLKMNEFFLLISTISLKKEIFIFSFNLLFIF